MAIIRYTKEGEPYIDPAEMKAQLTFLDPIAGSDASGSTVGYQVASPPDVTWAKVEAVRGIDLIKSGQVVSQVQIMAGIRYRAPGRSAQMRFQDSRGLVYVIQAIEDVVPGKLKYQVLTCLLIGAAA